MKGEEKNLFPGEYFWLEALFYSLALCAYLSSVPAYFKPPVFRHTHPAFCITHLSCLDTWPIAPLFSLKEHGQTLDREQRQSLSNLPFFRGSSKILWVESSVLYSVRLCRQLVNKPLWRGEGSKMHAWVTMGTDKP